MRPSISSYSPFSQSSAAGKTVVDHSSSLELQEANTRLRERLARMVQLINPAVNTHTHTCTVLYEHKRKGRPHTLYFQLTDKE